VPGLFCFQASELANRGIKTKKTIKKRSFLWLFFVKHPYRESRRRSLSNYPSRYKVNQPYIYKQIVQIEPYHNVTYRKTSRRHVKNIKM
jgi:hypothetical protein